MVWRIRPTPSTLRTLPWAPRWQCRWHRRGPGTGYQVIIMTDIVRETIKKSVERFNPSPSAKSVEIEIFSPTKKKVEKTWSKMA